MSHSPSVPEIPWFTMVYSTNAKATESKAFHRLLQNHVLKRFKKPLINKMTLKEPPRKQQNAELTQLITALKDIPLGEQGDILKQNLENTSTFEDSALTILKLMATRVKEQDQYIDVMDLLRNQLEGVTRGSFEIAGGKLVLDNVYGKEVFSGAALNGTWNFLVEDNDDGDARVCKCYHSSYPLLDSDKEAERKSMDSKLKNLDIQIVGEHAFMLICDGKYHNSDEAVPKETVAWIKGDRSTKWYSYYAAFAFTAILEHATTEKPYGFMIDSAEDQAVVVHKNEEGTIVGISFEAAYEEDEDDGGEDDDFDASEEDEEDD